MSNIEIKLLTKFIIIINIKVIKNFKSYTFLSDMVRFGLFFLRYNF